MIKIKNIYRSDTITFARALLALCFLVTLVFTPIYDLFPEDHVTQLKSNIHGLSNLNLFLWFDDIRIPYYFCLTALTLVISGAYPRYTCILQTWVSYSIFFTLLISEGGDQINIILTLLLVPVCILDNRKNGWRTDLKTHHINRYLLYNAAIAVFFIQLQMAVLYFNASVTKMFTPAWLEGTAVYYWFYDPTFGAPAWADYTLGFLFKNDYSVSLITWLIMILEITFFVGLFLKQNYKYLLFAVAFVFHFIIFLVHGLPSFGIAMTGGIVLFYFDLNKTLAENYSFMKRDVRAIFKIPRLQQD